MKPDRHNYEEYFLLYIDNELLPEQRKAVEQFVQDNPDLSEEFDLLRQTVFKADNEICFEGKETLLKTEESSAISLANYEEYLVAYIDDELTPGKKQEFEKFVSTHPQVKAELDVYMHTKLQPDITVVFPDKEILYRSEEEKPRVVYMQWWKVAVAAAVIMVAAISGFDFFNKESIIPGSSEVAKARTPAEKSNIKTITKEEFLPPPELQNKTTADEQPIENNIAATIGADKKNAHPETTLLEKQSLQETEKEKTTKSSKVVMKTEATIASSAIADNTINTVVRNSENIGASVLPAIAEKATENTIAMAEKKVPAEEKNVTNTPFNTYNKEIAQEDFDAVYASNNESKNRKLRGFFRKAARVFERRTNISATDDTEEKIMIGALAVKLK